MATRKRRRDHGDGIPLAIELATTRLGLLGVEGLLARLDDRLRLLTTGSPQALRKHQTLRAALEWSHGLLTESEQTALRRVGVFAGRLTLQAGQQVVMDEAIDGWAALDHLGTLVDKSLVTVEGDAPPRYRLLETTRLFALERLAASGETAVIRRRHALATLAILEDVDRRGTLNGGEVAVRSKESILSEVPCRDTWIGPGCLDAGRKAAGR